MTIKMKMKMMSMALSISCSIGVLMAIILTNNENNLPRTAVVVPTQNPDNLQSDIFAKSITRLPEQEPGYALPENIDRTITSSISPNGNDKRKHNIGQIITGDQEVDNPYPLSDKMVTVETGDTLFAISLRTGINVYQLAKINSIKEPYVIRPGQILHLGNIE